MANRDSVRDREAMTCICELFQQLEESGQWTEEAALDIILAHAPDSLIEFCINYYLKEGYDAHLWQEAKRIRAGGAGSAPQPAPGAVSAKQRRLGDRFTRIHAQLGNMIAGAERQVDKTITQVQKSPLSPLLSGIQEVPGAVEQFWNQLSALPAEIPANLGESTLEAVLSDRRSYYERNPGAVPKIQDLDGLIAMYSNENAAVFDGWRVNQGPLGMAAAVPDIARVFTNQIHQDSAAC